MVCAAGKIEEKEFRMANRGLDTGEFNEYGEWQSYRTNSKSWSGPSPFPLLALLMLIALALLLRGGPERESLSAQSATPELRMKYW